MKTVEASRLLVRGAQPWPMSVTAYHALGEAGLIPENTELLYGFVYEKMPKSPLHSALLRRLLKLLRQIPLRDCFISSEQPIACGDSEPEPDLAVIRGSEDDFWTEHPQTAELVIEICVSSRDYDRSKLLAYAAAGVKEVWLILAPEQQLEVYRLQTNGQFSEAAQFGSAQQVECVAVPAIKLQMHALFAQ